MSIPESRIRVHTKENMDILTCPLNDDIVKYISGYLESYAVSKDEFWANLGAETCNLRMMSIQCYNILENGFGRSGSITKYFGKLIGLKGMFCEIQNILDIAICSAYPRNVHEIDTRHGKKLIIQVFYNNQDKLEPFPIRYKKRGSKCRNSLTTQEIQYITTFISRMNDYIAYIERNINDFPDVKNYHAKNVKKFIASKTFKTKCSNLQEIHNVDIVNE